MAEQKVNLNEANRQELTRIVGIGDDCAERILRYREQHGRIQSVEEFVDELKGFGDQAMHHLRERAAV